MFWPARSTLRYLEAHGQDVAFEDGTYPGDYLIAVGQALKEKVGDSYLDKGEQFWLAGGARILNRRNDGSDPPRSIGTWRQNGCILFRKIALWHGPYRGGDRGFEVKGIDLSRVLGATKGKETHRLGAA